MENLWKAECKEYEYVALQNNGMCSCDNTYSTPATVKRKGKWTSKYKKVSDNQCNKGGTGKGDDLHLT